MDSAIMNVMKKILYSIAILGMAAGPGASADGIGDNQWGPVTNNAQISLAVKGGQRIIKTTEPVKLLVRFRNLSTNETFGVFRTGEVEYDDTYSWVVISPSGKDISPDFRNIPTSDNGHTVYIPPGQTNGVELNLRNLCRFDEVGTYKIVAKKEIWLRTNKPCVAISHLIEVTVAKDP
jgi:hypothetical protein